MKKQYKLFCLLTILLAQNTLFAQNNSSEPDVIIKNTTIIDVVQKTLLLNQDLVINNGHIISIQNTSATITAKKIIDGSNYIALPGFINTHTHLWQHISKSTYPKEQLQNWVKVYNPIHYLEPDELYKVVYSASSEALLSGITSVSDYASLSFNDYAFDVNATAMSDAGLGGVIVYNNPSVFVPDYVKIKEIPLLQQKYNNKFSIWMGFGPLSFYSIPQVYSGILIGKKLNMNFSEHTMENNQEQKDFFDSTEKYFTKTKGKLNKSDAEFLEKLLKMHRPSNVDAYEELIQRSSQILKSDLDLVSAQNKNYEPLTPEEKQALEKLQPQRLISPLVLLEYFDCLNNFLSIHSVWPQKEDLNIMVSKNISISHNPESNLYLSSGIAPINNYLKAGINITLGTDGAASNDGINMFSAMREMWNGYKIKLMNTEEAQKITDWDILQSATINGAKALKIDSFTGSLDVGKEADISLMAINELGMSPLRKDKLISLIINSGNARNIKYVFSDGNLIVENGLLLNKPEAQQAIDLTKIAASVDARIKTGKVWQETFDLNSKTLDTYWYKYRSIRKADEVNLTVTNKLSKPIKVYVISSGSVFGGGTPTVVDKEVSTRFPDDMYTNSMKEEFTIIPNENITINKIKGQYTYEIKGKGIIVSKSTSSGQLLIFAETK